MLRKVLASVVVLAVVCGFASAETIKGRITKIGDGKVSVAQYDKETKKLGEAKEYKLAKEVKLLLAGKDGAVATTLEGGLKNERITKISDKGVQATLEVTNDEVVSIIISAGGKKPKTNN